MLITLVFPLCFQILDFVMAGRRIVRLSEALDSLQIFSESSMVAHRLVENYWNRFQKPGNIQNKNLYFFLQRISVGLYSPLWSSSHSK